MIITDTKAPAEKQPANKYGINPELVILAQGGDLAARNDLWQAVKKYGYAVVNKYRYILDNDCSVSREDLEQTAAEAFCRALPTFDPTKGVPFPQWYYIYVQHCMAMYLHGAHGTDYLMPELRPHDYLDAPIPGFEEDLQLLDTIAADGPSVEDVTERSTVGTQVRDAVAAIPDNRQRQALTRKYFKGETLTAIAQDMGVSKQRVRTIVQAGENRLRSNNCLRDLVGDAYRKISLSEFLRTGISVTEAAAFPELRRPV